MRLHGLKVTCYFMVLLSCTTVFAANWPQFMRNAEHSGDAIDESLHFPLSLNAQVELDDAILSSPAVVDGMAYVIDQMGKAYCIDLSTKKIVWKNAPEGSDTFGSNTSSPCVVEGKVYYGTIAGNLHILNVNNGERIKTVEYEWPIMDAISFANNSIYFQTINGVIHCLDLDGETRWVWDHYGLTREKELENGTNPRTDGKSFAYFSTNPITISGKKVVTAIADDLLCLEDNGTGAELLWKTTEPLGRVYTMMGAAIHGDYVYIPCPGKDGKGGVIRVSLSDGSFDSDKDGLIDQWASFDSPAVRGDTMYYGRNTFGLTAYNFAEQKVQFSSFSEDSSTLIPTLSAPTLSKYHCLFTTTEGELIAVPLDSEGKGLKNLKGVFRYKTPHQKAIASSPVISDGKVIFGCDDSFLYVLGNEDAIEPKLYDRRIHQSKSETTVAGDRPYAWPTSYGGPQNTNFINDSGLKPPFRLKYAVKNGGLFKHPVCSTYDDLYYVTLGGLVVCREQETGRTRWRRKLPHQVWTRASLLCAEGNVYVSRMFSVRYPMVADLPSMIFCLDGENGDIVWQHEIGIGDRLRVSPVYVDGVVAYGSYYPDENPPVQKIEAWDASSGKELWKINVRSSGKILNGPSGCVGENVMYFTGGGEDVVRTGETIAIVPRTGKILWRTDKAYAAQTGTPSYRDGKIYLPGAYKLPMFCLNADNGEIVWKQDSVVSRWHVEQPSLGTDFFTVNNKYRGGAWRWNLEDGSIVGSYEEPVQLWGPAHGCGAIVLASEGFALSSTLEGIYAVDTNNGDVLWKSPGFASWTCPNPMATNGRIFYCPQVNGMLYCFEPVNQ
jgi:outer membrane protein assembly factor BamB